MSSFNGHPDVVTGTNAANVQTKESVQIEEKILEQNTESGSTPQSSMYPSMGILPQEQTSISQKEAQSVIQEMSQKTIIAPAKTHVTLGHKLPEVIKMLNKQLARKPLPGK